MTFETVHAVFVDRTVTLSESDVVERTGVTAIELHALADAGAVSLVSTAEGTTRYTIECLTVARTACRLREELALEDTHALAVVLRLTQRIGALQDEISQAIVAALKLKLLPEEKKAIEQRGTTDPEAYKLYLLARQYNIIGNSAMSAAAKRSFACVAVRSRSIRTMPGRGR
jgi:uncharacterized small protein (DUF1192 family)